MGGKSGALASANIYFPISFSEKDYIVTITSSNVPGYQSYWSVGAKELNYFEVHTNYSGSTEIHWRVIGY